jgi:SAM-dependent methyltransferase
MPVLKRMSAVMASPWVYRLWQAPFVKGKFAPVQQHNDLSLVRRVLDVGCGPGTNARFFSHADYVGLDVNPAYIERARRKYQGTFVEADVCTYNPPADQHFDFVLVNSLLHHLSDEETARVLSTLRRLIQKDGCIHILDLVLPDDRGVARSLARNDRGDYPRTVENWEQLLSRHFEPVVQKQWPVGLLGVELWQMLYFKGRVRH